MATGVASEATDEAVQANIIAAQYSRFSFPAGEGPDVDQGYFTKSKSTLDKIESKPLVKRCDGPTVLLPLVPKHFGNGMLPKPRGKTSLVYTLASLDVATGTDEDAGAPSTLAPGSLVAGVATPATLCSNLRFPSSPERQPLLALTSATHAASNSAGATLRSSSIEANRLSLFTVFASASGTPSSRTRCLAQRTFSSSRKAEGSPTVWKYQTQDQNACMAPQGKATHDNEAAI